MNITANASHDDRLNPSFVLRVFASLRELISYRRAARTLAAILFAAIYTGSLFAAEWRQFRGDAGNPSAEKSPPASWSAEKNVKWKSPLPGNAASSPIVVAGRVIVTAATGFRQDRLHVVAFSEQDGRKLWHRQFWATGRTACHPYSSVAANTPASDGKAIYALFSSNDLAALDLDGNLLWFRGLTHDYPAAANDVGMASSVAVADETVVVQVENEVDSFAAGIDSASGEERWRIPRPKKMNWASPHIMPKQGEAPSAVLLQSAEGVAAHNIRTGERLWGHQAGCGNIVSPFAHEGVVYINSDGLTALKPGGSVQVDVLWKENKLNPGSTTPVVHRGRIYTLNKGVLACADPADGKLAWQLRLKGSNFWASPIAAGDYVIVFNDQGLAQVVNINDGKGEVAETNELGDKVVGTPAIVDGALFVRSEKFLWKIAE